MTTDAHAAPPLETSPDPDRAASSSATRLELELEPGERWWGGAVEDGRAMPFGASPFRRDLGATSDERVSDGDAAGEPWNAPAKNQAAPLLVSTRGRVVWSERPFAFEVTGTHLVVIGSDLTAFRAGETLREAFLAASRRFFAPSGVHPALELFTAPQVNTWIEQPYTPTQESVLAYARGVLDSGMQPGVLIIDDCWSPDYGTWEFDLGRFPDPVGMVRTLHDQGFRVMLWLVPWVSPDSAVFRRLESDGLLLRDRDGETVVRRWWNGFSALLDISNPAAVAWLTERLDRLVHDVGIDGFKLDGGDVGDFRTDDRTTGGLVPAQMCEAWAAVGLRFPLNEYRACWRMGGQPLGQRLHDKPPSWGPDGIGSLVPEMLAQGMIGHPFVCPDMIGGGEIGAVSGQAGVDQEFFVRYAQVAALSPMMQFSIAPARVLDGEHRSAVDEALRVRAEMMPVIVSLVTSAAHTGEPVIRPMAYHAPELTDVHDQFFLGPDVVVAPVLERGATVRTVVLPEGRWTDPDGATVVGPAVVHVPCTLATIPRFVRAGGRWNERHGVTPPGSRGLPDVQRRDEGTRVVALHSQYPADLVGVPGDDVRLSWAAESTTATAQVAYQVRWRDDGEPAPNDRGEPCPDGDLGEGEWHDGEPVLDDRSLAVVPPGGAIPPGRARSFRVRIATAHGWTAWSAPLRVEAYAGGFTAGRVIGSHDGVPIGGPALYLRREVHVDRRPVRARLRISSLGVHDVLLNGERVGAEHLSPGWTSYEHRILVATHDVTAQLERGTNVLAVVVGDGWYRGRLGWTGSGLYGADLGLVAELVLEHADGAREVVGTDSTWRVGLGGVQCHSLYDGYEVDLRDEPDGWNRAGFDDSGWAPARVLDVPMSRFEPRIASPVRTVAEVPGVVSVGSPSGTGSGAAVTRVDLPQNITGWLRLRVRGRAGERIEVRHAEIVDDAGALRLEPLRTARAVDAYTLDHDGEHVLEPRLTYHGFQHADVVGGEVLAAVGVAISSALTPRSELATGRADLDRFHENVRWSQRDNFTSLPTDCPQRDERLGWTGDARAFAATASTLFDSTAFWRSWLRDLAADQRPDGAVTTVVPNHLLLGGAAPETYMQGRAGWADATLVVPWAVYESTGDEQALREQLTTGRAWVGYLADRLASTGTGFLPEEFQYGDWLDPAAPPDEPHLATTSSAFVAHAFLVWSARLLGRVERVVGDVALAVAAEALAEEVAARTWARWRDHALGTQTGCALAIELGVAPEAEHAVVGDRLGALVRASDGRIATGFLGTPHVLPALTRTGHDAEAYRMLLRDEPPSWLYQVRQGATTVWERWDAIRPDGSIHDGRMAQGDVMLSFNHYAYGAVIDWVYRHVAGLAPDPADPGYRTLVVAPRPARALGRASASVLTSFGRASVAWWVDGDDLLLDVEVPFNARARLDLAVVEGSRVEVVSGRGGAVDRRAIGPDAVLPAGAHRIVVRRARFADVSVGGGAGAAS